MLVAAAEGANFSCARNPTLSQIEPGLIDLPDPALYAAQKVRRCLSAHAAGGA